MKKKPLLLLPIVIITHLSFADEKMDQFFAIRIFMLKTMQMEADYGDYRITDEEYKALGEFGDFSKLLMNERYYLSRKIKAENEKYKKIPFKELLELENIIYKYGIDSSLKMINSAKLILEDQEKEINKHLTKFKAELPKTLPDSLNIKDFYGDEINETENMLKLGFGDSHNYLNYFKSLIKQCERNQSKIKKVNGKLVIDNSIKIRIENLQKQLRSYYKNDLANKEFIKEQKAQKKERYLKMKEMMEENTNDE